MSDDALIAAADLETVRQLRAALDVAMQENDQRIAVERALRTELEAARAVVRVTRSMPNRLMTEALECYDATPKAPPMAPPPDWWWV